MTEVEEVKQLLDRCTDEQCRDILQYIRRRVPIHPIEEKLNTQAEVVLEAISRASDLTLRGVRGIIAEVSFAVEVVRKLEGWRDVTPKGDWPFDFLLEDEAGRVSVQVKLQRLERGAPKVDQKASRLLGREVFVVETQRTRTGTHRDTGEGTRPYRFGEFDILAVSMHPSTNKWDSFMYTVGNWLLPRRDNPTLLRTLQPVASVPDEDWTDDFNTCVSWLRSGREKRICS